MDTKTERETDRQKRELYKGRQTKEIERERETKTKNNDKANIKRER